MKFKNCFIDSEGNIFKDSSLQKASENLPIIPFVITESLLEEILRWKLVNVRDYLTHFSRVKNADETAPIIIRSDGTVMDGWHRILKALYYRISFLPSRKFEVDPEPDFITGAK